MRHENREGMPSVSGGEAVYYDPYRIDITRDPYPVYRRLRAEAPLYYNEEHDFFAVSRFDDVERGLSDNETFSSARGGILEIIKMNVPMPSGVFIFEDPPLHTVHRGVLSKVFTPKKMNALEPKIREFCARCLDPLVGAGRFDFVADLGAQMPMRVIGMLLGIPEQDLSAVRESADARLRTEEGQAMEFTLSSEAFAQYVDWREKNPADDLMTELLHTEFVDQTGTRRRLTRGEILLFVDVLAGAGNETTNRLIGWAGKTLADHPDQRRQLVEDRSLIPIAIEEILRFEPPGPHVGRYVTRAAEFHGRKVPAGSAILFLVGSANRDERRFRDGDRFDINREKRPHLSFGHGIHTCLGAALARVEARVALDEVLDRFPEWDVEIDKARLTPTSTVRGWETLPVVTR